MLMTRILVPYDFGDPSKKALAYAKGLAERFDAALDLLTVVPDPNLYWTVPADVSGAVSLPTGSLDDFMSDARKRLEEAFPPGERGALDVTLTVRLGDARAEILARAAAGRVDLIVMGTHGREGMAHLLLGSVAERIVRSAPCPVLTVR